MINVTVQTCQTNGAWTICVSGNYGVGSAGNEDADAIVQELRSILGKTDGAPVVLDMSGMHYEWGDAIGSAFVGEEFEKVEYRLNIKCEKAWSVLLSLIWGRNVPQRIVFK
jgi:hypothetical protein